jgi:hypothetical protein
MADMTEVYEALLPYGSMLEGVIVKFVFLKKTSLSYFYLN